MSGESTVSVQSDKAAVSAVGSLVGLCQGTVENCTSSASITVAWDDGNEGNGRDPQVVMENIGGIAGICDGNLSGSSFSGTLAATSSANAKTEGATTNAFVARNIGGVVGRSGGEDFAATGQDVANSNAGSVAGCSNSGSVSVYTLGQGGTDRFGEVVEAKSESVGGVAGYACGNVSSCANSGNVLATGYNGEGDPFTTWVTGEDRDAYENTSGGGVKVGGVVGSLRAGVSASGNAGSKDAGVVLKQAAADPYITLDGCTNTGYVSGLNAVGGIVGTAGTFTTVTHCINGDVDADGTTDTTGYVRTTRWNKPNGGGIVGGLFDYDESSIRVSDLPEIYGCYNTGQVTSWSSGAILGENNGYVHDCVALKDADPSNCLVYATSWAIVDNCVVACATADEAAALTDEQAEAFGGRVALNGGAALAVLNTQSMADGFDGNYYFIPTGTAKGFPVLDGEDYGRSSYDLSTLQLDVESDGKAPYTVAYDPVPTVTAKALIDGEWVALYENVDYIVVADPEAKGKDAGDATYHAGIRGIGNYTGIVSSCIDYRIVKGDLADCTIVATSATYNRRAQNSPEIILLDKGKASIDSSEFENMVVNGGHDCVEPGTYTVSVQAAPDGNYEGTATGEYAIAKVNLIHQDLVGVTWQNRVWYYDENVNELYEVDPVLDETGALTYGEDGRPVVKGETVLVDDETGRRDTRATAKNTDESGNVRYGMSVDYTGSDIQPEVIGVRWTYSYVDESGKTQETTELLKPTKLVNGVTLDPDRDLRVLYGTSTVVAGTSNGNQSPNRDAGEKAGGVTVAYSSVYVGNAPITRFHNYWVMLFDIEGENYDLSQASVAKRYGEVVRWTADDTEPQVPALDMRIGDVDLDPSAYDFVVVKTTDENGVQDEANCFAEGHQVYYRLVSKTDEGVFVDLETLGEKPYRIMKLDDISINDDAVTKKIPAEVDVLGDPLNAYTIFVEAFSFVDSRSGNELKLGFDYTTSGNLSVASNRSTGFATASLGRASTSFGGVAGRGYTGTCSLDPINQTAMIIDQSAYIAQRRQDTMALTTSDTYRPGTVEGGLVSNKFAWCEGGYTAEQLAAKTSLQMSYVCDASGKRVSSPYAINSTNGLKVSKIVNESGQTVDKVTDLGKYTLTISKDASTAPTNIVIDSVDFEVEVVAPNIATSGAYSGEYLFLQWGARRMQTPNNYLSPKTYAYTGEVIVPTFAIVDATGKGYISPDDYVVTASGVDVGSHPFTIAAKEGSIHLFGEYEVPASSVSSKGYKITKANLASETVDVCVEDAVFTGNAVEPQVTFWDMSDPDNPKQLSYKLGQDYDLEYSNNIVIADKTSENAPTVKVTAKGSNMEEAVVEVPFSITGAPVDVKDCDFIWSDTLIAGFQPTVVGSYTQGGVSTPLASDSFAVAICSDVQGTAKVDSSSLKAGDTVYYRIDGNTAASLTGSRMLGPVSVVAADAANSFDQLGQAGNGLSVEVASCVYTGFPLQPVVTVKNGGNTLVEGKDYVLSWGVAVNVNDSEANRTVTVTGLNGYGGSYGKVFAITPANLAETCIASVAAQQFTGEQVKPGIDDVTVMWGSDELNASSGAWQVKTDGYGDNVHAGLAAGSMTLVGEGNFAGELVVTFDIQGQPLNSDDFVVLVADQAYTGNAVEVPASDVKVYDLSKKAYLALDDYSITGFGSNVNVGTATVSVTGKGDYSGNMSGSFNIVPASLTADMVSIGADSYSVVKGGVKPVPIVMLGSKVLPTSDYVVTYGENVTSGKAAGTVTVTPVSGGNLQGESVTISFDITDDIAAATVNVVTPGSYNASGITPPVLEVLYGSPAVELVEGEDYKIELSSDKAAGTMTARIVGLDKFDGSSLEFEYSVNGKSLAAPDVTVEVEQGSVEVEPGSFAYEYTGSEVQPVVTVKDGSVELAEDIDYELTYTNNVAAGKGKVRIAAKKGGNYAEFVEATFTIAPVDVASQKVSITVQPKSAFAGAPLEADVEATHTPDAAVAYALDVRGAEPISLVLNRDFALKYKNNDKPGLATVTITGMGNYAGEVDKTFPVKVDLKSASITPVKNVLFAGEPVDQAPEVKAGTYVLTPGIEYEVSYAVASDNGELNEDGLPCAPGSYLRKVSGMGGYVLGEVSEAFEVEAADDNPSEGGNEPGDGGDVPGNPDGADNNPANLDGSASGNQGGSSTGGDRNASAEDASQSLAKTGDFNLIAVPVLVASALCAVATLALSRRKEANRR